jgi:hypothetical protein
MRAPRHVGTIHGYAINKRTPALLTSSRTGSARDRQHRHHSPVAAVHSARVQPAARPDKRKASQLTATQMPLSRASNSTASQLTATQTPLFRAYNSTASHPANCDTNALFRASISTASRWHDGSFARLPGSPVTLIVNICYSGCLQISTSHTLFSVRYFIPVLFSQF